MTVDKSGLDQFAAWNLGKSTPAAEPQGYADALAAIAALPYNGNEAGHEDAYRAVEALALPPDTHSAGYVEGLEAAKAAIADICPHADVPGGFLVPNSFDEGTSAAFEAVNDLITEAPVAAKRTYPIPKTYPTPDAISHNGHWYYLGDDAARSAPQPTAVKIELLGAAFDAAIFSDVESLYETDGSPHPAADTRVVTVDQLQRWCAYADDGLVSTPVKEIRAIIEGGQGRG